MILARNFGKFCRGGKAAPTLSQNALEELRTYPWPGNVRELQNCIERAVILCDDDTIQPRHLNLSFRQPAAPAPVSPWEQIDLSGSLSDALRRVIGEVERRKVEHALREAGGNKQRCAAEQLQITYRCASRTEGVRIPDGRRLTREPVPHLEAKSLRTRAVRPRYVIHRIVRNFDGDHEVACRVRILSRRCVHDLRDREVATVSSGPASR